MQYFFPKIKTFQRKKENTLKKKKLIEDKKAKKEHLKDSTQAAGCEHFIHLNFFDLFWNMLLPFLQ